MTNHLLAQHEACIADPELRQRAHDVWDSGYAMWQNIYDSTQGGSLSRDGSSWLGRLAGRMAVLRALTGNGAPYSIGSDGYLTRARCDKAISWAADPRSEG
jgi:hypothetical protein